VAAVGMWRLRRLRTGSTPLEPLPTLWRPPGSGRAPKQSVPLGGGGGRSLSVLGVPSFSSPRLFDQPASPVRHRLSRVSARPPPRLAVHRRGGVCGRAGLVPSGHLCCKGNYGWRASRSWTRSGIAHRGPRPVRARLTGDGRRPSQFDLAPASLFLRKRHLASRVHSLLKEVTMSRGRLISSYVLTAALCWRRPGSRLCHFRSKPLRWFSSAEYLVAGQVMVEVHSACPIRCGADCSRGWPNSVTARTPWSCGRRS